MLDKKKKEKYALELQKLKGLRAINRILKKGDMENALLASSAKETEQAGNENVIDSMLTELNKNDKKQEQELEIVERLTTMGRQGAKVTTTKRTSVKKAGNKVKVKRKIHAVKSKGKKKRR